MSDATPADTAATRDYSKTLFLPRTDFPMRAGLPTREPLLLERWETTDLYGQLRARGQGRPKFVLHDGPPYANGNIHIGTALNKILKDVIVRSMGALGYEAMGPIVADLFLGGVGQVQAPIGAQRDAGKSSARPRRTTR